MIKEFDDGDVSDSVTNFGIFENRNIFASIIERIHNLSDNDKNDILVRIVTEISLDSDGSVNNKKDLNSDTIQLIVDVLDEYGLYPSDIIEENL